MTRRLSLSGFLFLNLFKPLWTFMDIVGRMLIHPHSFLPLPMSPEGVKSKRKGETAFLEELHFGEAAFLCAGKRKGRSILFLFVWYGWLGVSLASSLGLLSPENNPPLFSESNNTLTCLLIELNLLGKHNQNMEPQHFIWGLVYNMELSVTYCLRAEFNFNSCCLTWTFLSSFLWYSL